MRRFLILPIVFMSFLADFSAFGATARGGRGTTNVAGGGGKAPVAARAATRGGVKTVPTGSSTTQTGGVAARSAQKTTPIATVAGGVSGNVAARAGNKQKVINMGTKIESAMENTVVDQECQDAYFGCMDAFCMLDNTVGGRCQCSDAVEELSKQLEEIQKLDNQSYILATEGMERLQMGENAEEILARTKSVTSQLEKENAEPVKEEKKKAKTLDLSAWDNIFDDNEEEEEEQNSAVVEEFTGKKGDALHAASAKLCKKQLPNQCTTSADVLQVIYMQKIKSDCSAYENSLSKQKTESAKKLQTAQKALRETALEQFQEENKYDLGECTVQFRKCMQTTAGCGEDFSGCVADTVSLSIGKTQVKVAKPKIVKAGTTTIELDAQTYGVLDSKKIMCESVTKQCVKVKDQVWEAFLRDVAPTMKMAELNAESNRRTSCSNSIVACVQKACGSQWDAESDNYDMCISDTSSVEKFCKVEIQRCGDVDISGTVLKYVTSKLNAMRVDRCTEQVKECLQNENVCGADYLGCIGLSSNKILELCPFAKLTACQTKFNESTVRDYVIKIAQGVALNIDNSFVETCQKAVDESMVKICGSTDNCDGLVLNTMSNDGLTKALFNYSVCLGGTQSRINAFAGRFSSGGEKCYSTVEDITNDDIYAGLKSNKKYTPVLQTADLSQILSINGEGPNAEFVSVYDNSDQNVTGAVDKLVENVNRSLNMVMASIEEDTTVKACKQGRDFQGFDKNSTSKSYGRLKYAQMNALANSTSGRFPNLTDNIKNKVATMLYNQTLSDYSEKLAEYEEKRMEDAATLAAKYAQNEADREKSCKAMASETVDATTGSTRTVVPEYVAASSTCILTIVVTKCWKWEEDGETTISCGTPSTSTEKYDMKTGKKI